MNRDGLFAFYGTLRMGMENHSLYAKGMRFQKTVPLSGFRLYSLGDYPYAVRTSDGGIIIADLFKITDATVADAIHRMEIEAGYYYDEIAVEKSQYGIYLFPSPDQNDEEITTGDWVKYVTQNGF